MKNLYFLFSFHLFITFSLHAQNKIVKIWPGIPPASIENPGYSEEKIVKDGETQRVSKVTDPEFTVYPPAKPNGTAVLILPGGGYGHLSIQKEGKKIAQWFNSFGVTAFMLKYRLPNGLIMKDKSIGPLQDAQEAMRIIRRNAGKWKISPDKIGVIGFSAGGHLAATLSTQYSRKVYTIADSTSARPDFCLLIYPVISMKDSITHKVSRKNLLGDTPSDDTVMLFSNEENVTAQTPPTFIIHAADDKSVPVENSLLYFSALKRNKVAVELHVYETGGHGFGLGENKNTYWPELCIKWMKMHMLLLQ